MTERRAPWAWVGIVLLVLITRLTEMGVSLDPALFASIARNIVRSGNIWSLYAGEKFFPQFYEHPFFGIWAQALVFKLFGSSELTSRLVGVFFGAGTFYYLYRLGERLVDARFANVFCFISLLSIYFVGRMPTFYFEVPLTFFLIGSFYYFWKALLLPDLKDEVLSGLFLGLAFLTKGLACLPLIALMGACALYHFKQDFWKVRALWLVLGLTAFIIFLFCILQASYGSYPFWSLYWNRHHVQNGAANRVFEIQFLFAFLKKFWQTHSLHLILAGVGIGLFIAKDEVRSSCREALFVGGVGSFLFLLANGSIGLTHLHYFYTIYPVSNLVATIGLYPIALKKPEKKWMQWGLGIAVVYLLIWQVLPLSMRRKADLDYYQLKGAVDALKEKGVQSLEGLGIGETEWDIREVSLWYWDIETFLLPNANDVKGRAVLVRAKPETKGMEAELEKRKYLFCAGSPKFSLYVNSESLQESCRHAKMDIRLLK